ncbi:alpha/beta hydrolase family protein [Amycolatopsis sp. cg5]|uniref:alpha/beta hydrolase family protein n=1 Tax=Amycolatopsis sp. cg5 TaxID=3238802 RepID=UPI0035269DC7
MPHRRTRRGLFAAGLAALSAFTVAAPASAAPAKIELTLPALTGQHQIGTTTLHLVDRSRPDPWKPDRKRELMATVTYPSWFTAGAPRARWMSDKLAPFVEEAAADPNFFGLPKGSVDWGSAERNARVNTPVDRWQGKRPVVLFSPGFGSPRELHAVLTDDLASRGYIVVSLSHTFESAAVEFPGGRVEPQLRLGTDPATMKTAIDARVADTRFLLDQLTKLDRGLNPDAEQRPLPLGLAGALDLSKVGMFGHSYGGFTAGETMVTDRRIDAGVNLDGTMGYGFDGSYLPGEVVKRGLDRPFLLMGGGFGFEHTHLNPADKTWVDFWANQRGWKRDLLLKDGAHHSYSDLQALVPQFADLVPAERRDPGS